MSLYDNIYDMLTGSTGLTNYISSDNIRYKVIPSHWNFSNDLIVIELDSEGIIPTLGDEDTLEEYRLRVKILTKDLSNIDDITNIVKRIYIYGDADYYKIQNIKYIRSVMIYEREYDVFTMNIDFDVFYQN